MFKSCILYMQLQKRYPDQVISIGNFIQSVGQNYHDGSEIKLEFKCL